MTALNDFKPVRFWLTGPPREYGAYRFRMRFMVADIDTRKVKIFVSTFPVIMHYDMMQPRHIKKMIKSRNLPPQNHIYEQGYICAN